MMILNILNKTVLILLFTALIITTGCNVNDNYFSTNEENTLFVEEPLPPINESNDGHYKREILENEVFEATEAPVIITKPISKYGKNYVFVLSQTSPFENTKYYSESGEYLCSAEIEVYNSDKTKCLQRLMVDGIQADVWGGMFIEDVNFDGYNDIVVNRWITGNQMAYGNMCWIWNNDTEQFEEENSFGMLNAMIDTKHKVIRASWRSSATEHGFEAYRFIDGKFILTNSLISDSYNLDEIRKYTEKTLVDGVMEKKEIYFTNDEGSPLLNKNSFWYSKAEGIIPLWSVKP